MAKDNNYINNKKKKSGKRRKTQVTQPAQAAPSAGAGQPPPAAVVQPPPAPAGGPPQLLLGVGTTPKPGMKPTLFLQKLLMAIGMDPNDDKSAILQMKVGGLSETTSTRPMTDLQMREFVLNHEPTKADSLAFHVY